MGNIKISNRDHLQIMKELDAATNNFVNGLHSNALSQQEDLVKRTEATANDRKRSAWFAFAAATVGALASAGAGFTPKDYKIFNKVNLQTIFDTASKGLDGTNKVISSLGDAEHAKAQTLLAMMRDTLSRVKGEIDRSNDSEREMLRAFARSLETLYDAKNSAIGR